MKRNQKYQQKKELPPHTNRDGHLPIILLKCALIHGRRKIQELAMTRIECWFGVFKGPLDGVNNDDVAFATAMGCAATSTNKQCRVSSFVTKVAAKTLESKNEERQQHWHYTLFMSGGRYRHGPESMGCWCWSGNKQTTNYGTRMSSTCFTIMGFRVPIITRRQLMRVENSKLVSNRIYTPRSEYRVLKIWYRTRIANIFTIGTFSNEDVVIILKIL